MVLPPIPAPQPTTVTYVLYQRVQHALADGTPDPNAPDNFYIRQTCTWYLTADTDAVVPDATGTKHVHVPGYRWRMLQRFEQKGRLRGRLRDRFTEVYPDQKGIREIGIATIPPDDFDDASGMGRHVSGILRTILERVESHNEGRNHATLVQRESYWSVRSGGTNGHQPFLPEPIPGVGVESKPPVRFGTPTFGYGPVVLPKDDDF